jgi:hypothetical protein
MAVCISLFATLTARAAFARSWLIQTSSRDVTRFQSHEVRFDVRNCRKNWKMRSRGMTMISILIGIATVFAGAIGFVLGARWAFERAAKKSDEWDAI